MRQGAAPDHKKCLHKHTLAGHSRCRKAGALFCSFAVCSLSTRVPTDTESLLCFLKSFTALTDYLGTGFPFARSSH